MYSEGDIVNIINKMLFTFSGGITMTFIKKISDSIASKDLFLPIDKIDKKYNTPASKLIETSVKLNFPGELNKKDILELNQEYKDNYLAKTILKLLTIEHLYKFTVNYSEKQSLCDSLNIDFIQATNMLDIGRKK